MIQRPVKPVILIICAYYLPGYESGGAMRTLVNMVDRLGGIYNFRIITRDHDGKHEKTPYTSVNINAWNRVGNADVFYLSQENIRPKRIKSLIDDVRPDSIYLNSFFSPLTILVLFLRWFGSFPQCPVILAPEGEFSAGALTLKPFKKKLYLRLAKLMHLHRNVVWKAASDLERTDIVESLGKTGKLFVAPNMPPKMIFEDFEQFSKPEKRSGHAKMVFLSRFMRKKNFNWLLEHLRTVSGDLAIDVYGPIEEADYRDECQRLMKTLPANIKIEIKGPVHHARVSQTLANYHFFILPTLGENFGHIFLEALASGCPLIISDRTPWRKLEEKGIGWDLPLEKSEAWIEAINECMDMDQDHYSVRSQKARLFSVAWLEDPAIEESNNRVLESSVSAKLVPARAG